MSARTKLFSEHTKNSENIFTSPVNKLSHKCERKKIRIQMFVFFPVFPFFFINATWRHQNLREEQIEDYRKALWRKISIFDTFFFLSHSIIALFILCSRLRDQKMFSFLPQEYFLLSTAVSRQFYCLSIQFHAFSGFMVFNTRIRISIYFACRLYQAWICFYIHDSVKRRSLILSWFSCVPKRFIGLGKSPHGYGNLILALSNVKQLGQQLFLWGKQKSLKMWTRTQTSQQLHQWVITHLWNCAIKEFIEPLRCIVLQR